MEAVDPAKRTLAMAQAFFDMGGTAVPGISNGRPPRSTGGAVTARKSMGGSGMGGPTVRSDESMGHQGTVTPSGVESVGVPPGPAARTEHTEQGRITAGGTEPRAVTAFDGATERLRITAEGVIDGGVVGRPYKRTLGVVGGSAPYSWKLVYGELPPGLSLDPTGGTLQGTPSRTGTWVGVVRVRDSGGKEATTGIRITVAASPLEIMTETLPAAVAGSEYTATLEVEGGTTPYIVHVIDGTLPKGLVLHASSGVIEGVPEEPCRALFTVEALDRGRLTSERVFELVVNERAQGIPSTQESP